MIRAFPSCVINAFVVKNAAWPDADRIQFLNFHHFSKRKKKKEGYNLERSTDKRRRGENKTSEFRSIGIFLFSFFFLSLFFFSVPLTDSSPSCIPYNASINCPGFYRWIHFFFSLSLSFFLERTEQNIFYFISPTTSTNVKRKTV